MLTTKERLLPLHNIPLMYFFLPDDGRKYNVRNMFRKVIKWT